MNIKSLTLISIILVVVIIYVSNMRDQISRYKSIIDSYTIGGSEKKSILKKVRFKLPEDE